MSRTKSPMPTEPLKVLANIIRIEMRLKNDQVLIDNQKFEIPNDNRMYLSVSLAGFKTFGSKNKHVNNPVTGLLDLTQTINRQETYSILLYSKGPDARTRNWEVVAALNSDTSQSWQETNSMKIATLPASMVSVPELEGTSRLFRYSLLVNALVAYEKKSSPPFFDQFSFPPKILVNQ